MSIENPRAFVFPGQGTQAHIPELVSRLFSPDNPREVFRTSERIYEDTKDILGADLRKISESGSVAELTQPGIIEPAIMTASIALLEVLKEHYKVKPDVVAGHSMGQVTASYAAEALTLEQAQLLLKGWGEYMTRAGILNPGTMVAILGLNYDEVLEICAKTEEALARPGSVPANINGPTHIVVSGEIDAITYISQIVRDKGKKAIELKVNVAAHSYFMEPARQEMKLLLQRIKVSDPLIPIVDNSIADYVETKEGVAAGLIDAMTAKVLWADSITRMTENGVREFEEVGPGNVLSNTIRRIDPSLSVSHGVQRIPIYSATK